MLVKIFPGHLCEFLCNHLISLPMLYFYFHADCKATQFNIGISKSDVCKSITFLHEIDCFIWCCGKRSSSFQLEKHILCSIAGKEHISKYEALYVIKTSNDIRILLWCWHQCTCKIQATLEAEMDTLSFYIVFGLMIQICYIKLLTHQEIYIYIYIYNWNIQCFIVHMVVLLVKYSCLSISYSINSHKTCGTWMSSPIKVTIQ